MKRLISLLLCLVLATGLAVTARADDYFEVTQTFDYTILAGGIYDMYAWVGGDHNDYTFQWQVDLGFGKGSWSDLEDNADPYGYSGTDTYHMEFITPRTNGYIIGTGWENIPFRCVVTSKKTGVSYTTASIFMRVFTSDDLPEYLEGQGFGLYEPTISGASKPVTRDDINYTASAFSGTQLKLICGCWKPDGEHLLRRSNFTEDVEVWITENGKTVKTIDGATYTPYTIGKDALTVQFKLHHTLGIHDLGYYETKNVRLTLKEPDPVAYGTANNQISLLRERYNESQKLSTIPKGTQLKITEKSSGWYQVSYNGLIGYVSSSAVTLREGSPTIEHVDITIEEPVADKLPATTCTVSPSDCTVTYLDWYDLTDTRFLNPGERFRKGHSYQLVIWASAKDGYKFKLDPNEKVLTTALINGNLPAFTSRAYEQIIGKVIEIRYDFNNVKDESASHKCSPALVPRVEPSCTGVGHEAYYHCSCGADYKDAAATQPVDVTTWGVLSALGHQAGNWTGNGTHHYKKCTRCYQVITGTNASHSGGTATCIERAKCAVCGLDYGQVDPEHRWGPGWDYKDAQGHAWVCADCKTHSAITAHIPGPAATETTPQTCTACGYVIQPVKEHVHNLTKVEERKPTCTSIGNRSYYICSGCDGLFEDKNGKNPLTDSVLLPIADHQPESGWTNDDFQHWKSCKVCQQQIAETVSFHVVNGNFCGVCGYQFGPVQEPEPTVAPTTPPPTVAPTTPPPTVAPTTPPPTEEPTVPPTTLPPATSSPAETTEGTIPTTGTTESPGSTESTPGHEDPVNRKDQVPGWAIAVMIGLICFGTAILGTVLLMKKKG